MGSSSARKQIRPWGWGDGGLIKDPKEDPAAGAAWDECGKSGSRPHKASETLERGLGCFKYSEKPQKCWKQEWQCPTFYKEPTRVWRGNRGRKAKAEQWAWVTRPLDEAGGGMTMEIETYWVEEVGRTCQWIGYGTRRKRKTKDGRWVSGSGRRSGSWWRLEGKQVWTRGWDSSSVWNIDVWDEHRSCREECRTRIQT